MNTRTYAFSGLIILLVVSAVSFYAYSPSPEGNTTSLRSIRTFEECIADGNPVMESSPRQCRTKEGKLFTEGFSSPSMGATSSNNETITATTSPSTFIQLASPTQGARVSSPLVITGKARGAWYFEGSFPLELVDASGTPIASGIAYARGDWMTDNLIPFTASLTWATTTTAAGTLILHRDNPSGLPAKDESIKIPVVF